MTTSSLPAHKRTSHRLKTALYRRAALDAWLDRHLDVSASGGHAWRLWARERLLLRLLPERRMRASPFSRGSGEPSAGLARILTLVPPEDTGGGSRPAQLAAELHRRGHAIEWRWALPIYPWPRLRRPPIAGVDARHIDEPAGPGDTVADLVLVEAPHPRLCAWAREGARRGPLVYDAIDVWDGPLGAGWYQRADEERVVAEADVLVASAQTLRDEVARRTGRSVELLPNAVDAARFRAGAAPAEIRRGTPTVVYVGALWGEWVDLELVEQLARARPAAVLHLVGPAGSRRLPTAPNICIHGARPRDEIPGLLAAADVAIVPFTPGRLTAAVSPLKVFEYLCLERPVVSTRLRELEGVPGVTLADDADAFVDAVGNAAAAEFPREAVRTFVDAHTWSRRVDRLLELSRSVRR